MKRYQPWGVLAVLLLAGCPLGTNTGNGADRPLPVGTSLTVRLVNAATGEPLGLSEIVPFALRVAGADKALVTDAYGNPAPGITTTGGSTIFQISDQAAPSPANPLNFTVLAQGEGFVPTSSPVSIDSTGHRTLTFYVVETRNPPAGVASAFYEAGAADLSGALTRGMRIDTPPESVSGTRAGIEMQAGTVMLAGDGTPLSGALTMSLTFFGNQGDQSLRSFPGGFGANLAKDELGLPNTNSVFLSGGFVAVEISDQNGNLAKTFSEPIAVSAQIAAGTVNPGTGQPVQAGDTIPIWSYDRDTGEWTYESLGNITGPDGSGNFTVSFQAQHLSFWNMDWKTASCASVTLNLDRSLETKGLPLGFKVRPAAGGSYLFSWQDALATGDSLFFTRVPKAYPLHLEAYYQAEQVGAMDVTFDDACNAVAMPIAFPKPVLWDVPIELLGNCNPLPRPFAIPGFRYEFHKKVINGDVLVAEGVVEHADSAIVANVPTGTYDVYFWPLGTSITPFPLILRNRIIDGNQGTLTQNYYLNCDDGTPANVAITEMKSEPAEILAGDSVQVTWRSRYADSCTLGGLPVAANGGASYQPGSSVNYTLTCQGQGPYAKAVAGVKVTPQVQINSFSASTLIQSGDPATFNWSASNATSCSINIVGAVGPAGPAYGYPTQDTAYTLTCQGAGGPVTAVDSVTVHHYPVGTNPGPVVTDEDTPVGITLTGTDVEDVEPALNVTIAVQPAHGSLDVLSGGAPLSAQYTPDPDYFGSDSFTFRVSDSDPANSQLVTVSITVNPVNDAPVATSVTLVQLLMDGSAQISLTGTDVDNLVSDLAVEITTPAASGLLDPSTGAAPLAVTYTPNAGYLGADSFSFRVKDPSLAASAPVSVDLSVLASTVAAKLVFTTAPQSAVAGTCAGPVSVQRQDAGGAPISMGTTTVNLLPGGSLGVFSNSGCTSSTTQVQIPGGSSSVNVYIRGTVTGTFSLSAADNAGVLTGASQDETITAGAAAALAFGVPPATSEWVELGWAQFTVRIEDAFGNLVASATDPVTVSLASGTGTLSGTIPVYASGGIASFGDLSYDTAEDITIDVTSGALTGILGVAVQVQAAATWTAVSAGGAHTCGIRSRALYCWGQNNYGQLGDGTSGAGTQKFVPTRVGLASDWSALAAGDYHTCGLRSGALYCWGYNDYGQLGDGTSGAGTQKSVPTRVGAATDWSAVAAGSYHTCGIRSGAFYCWGRNDWGELGDGTAVDKPTPTQAGTASDWSAVAVGSFHTCGIRGSGGSGALYCWGANNYGQLGDGTSGAGTDKSVPTRVGTASDWSALSVGGIHTPAAPVEAADWAPSTAGGITTGANWAMGPRELGRTNPYRPRWGRRAIGRTSQRVPTTPAPSGRGPSTAGGEMTGASWAMERR